MQAADEEARTAVNPVYGRRPFVPVLLTAVALLGWMGVQTTHFMMERRQLQQAIDAQQPQMEAAGRIRSSLDRLAVSTQRLADEGNQTASELVGELRRRGVTIRPERAEPTSR